MMAFVSKRFGAANIIVSNAPQSDELDVFIVDEELPPEMLVTPQAGNDDDERCMPVQVEGEHLLYNATTALLRATSLVPRDHLVAHEFRKTCVAYAMELIVQNRTDFHELIAAFAPYADPEVEAAYPGAAAAVEDLYDRANLEHLKVIDDLLDEGDQEGAFKYGLAMMHLAYVILVKYPCVPSLAGRAESALERYYPIAQKIDAGRADEYLRQQGEVCAATIAELVEVTSAEVVAGFQKMKYIAERLPQGPLEAQTPAPAQARVTPLALLH
jgi:hypothetical protein